MHICNLNILQLVYVSVASEGAGAATGPYRTAMALREQAQVQTQERSKFFLTWHILQ